MKKIFFIILLITVNQAIAQSAIDTTIKIDLLRTTVSPASNLLNIATSDIDKPTDISAFMVSLQSATNSFTKLPSSYAIDIGPYWLFKNSKKGDITTEGFKKSTGPDVFKQTLILSFAIKNPDSLETGFNTKSTYGGFGVKFSIFRGKYDEETKNALDAIKRLQDVKLRHLEDILSEYKVNANPRIGELRKKMKDVFRGFNTNDRSDENIALGKRKQDTLKLFSDTLSTILSSFSSSRMDSSEALQSIDRQIQQIAADFHTNRIGFTWDFNAGISGEFFNKRFDRSKVHNAGIWTNIGYTTNNGSSFLALVRYLYNPDQIFAKDNATNDVANISTMDGGFKYAYSKSQSKFSGSIEGIYRSVLSGKTINSSWRLILNADYDIGQNQRLTFAFGRNFDGTISKDGNLVAALSFLTGFGNKR
ncbi:MAG: hypothetical protein ABIS01_05730 [Ferruginibacter sp.]